MSELKFKRTVKQFGDMGKIIITSTNLSQFAGKEVEITVKEIELNENKGH